ncbi:MAG: polyphenol oxidase family protein [Acidimicrobiales bacterium]
MTRATGSVRARGPVSQVHWLDQVHGTGVVAAHPRAVAAGVGPHGVTAVFAGPGDALVSDSPECALVVLTADCASIALGSGEGVFGVVHAGWRGLAGGVVERTVAAMRAMGATRVVGAVGPCIHAGCYEFSEGDLARVAAVRGHGVRSLTASGRPALDVPAAVSSALAASGADQVVGVDACTACGSGYFSHRARGDGGRQALVVWSDAVPGGG